MIKYSGFLLMPLIAACSTIGSSQMREPAVKASAILMENGQNVGAMTLTQNSGGARLQLSVIGMAQGEYGMHLHEFGKCEGPEYKTAGMHWNPAGRQHGINNPQGSHVGDLPNLKVTGSAAQLDTQLEGLRLTGSDALLDADGASFIIHAKPDDYKTDPSGNSGGRKICGVITLMN
jgi:superoxide dismutase, Cu-Zn family